MLYRFREAQAAELGLGTRSDRRPRMASACKSLRECERWRGEILREISRKVSKIQDCLSFSCCPIMIGVQIFLRTAGLTDYEVRDLNDEINKLMREKRHWENQIIALGGANYRRNVAMLDDDGREVPGTKGYKCANTSLISFFSRSDLNPLKILRSSQGVAGCQRAL
jgi:pre-mRNA-splicing factor ISY1